MLGRSVCDLDHLVLNLDVSRSSGWPLYHVQPLRPLCLLLIAPDKRLCQRECLALEISTKKF